MRWIVALVIGIVVALIQYGWRELRTGAPAAVAALLRVAAVTLLVALLLDAAVSRPRATGSWVAIDVSQSMTRAAGADSALWRQARDAVQRARPESLIAFGDSARPMSRVAAPRDLSSGVRPLAERAMGSGHPVTVITDGELDDADAAQSLPAGSRVEVISRPGKHDLAISAVDAPRAIVSGDTVDMRVTVTAGNAGSTPATLTLARDGATITTVAIDALPVFGERTVSARAPITGPVGSAVLSAVLSSRDDAEARNDTLLTAIDLSRAPSAVFVSTAPDFDARYALAVLRGALSIPTRGFFRVATGQWRLEGPLTPVAETDVRAALRDAPVAILHGDTATFGPPRSVTAGPLALVTPGADAGGEWYPSTAPASPLASALAGVPWDSLPPVSVSSTPPKGQWNAVIARRNRGEDQQALIVGSDEPRRVIVVAASGLWRWRFRGGVSSDAFTALWGSIFDWLAAERADRRAAVPDERSLRAGEPVRWRRGSPIDSLVRVTLRRRSAGATGPARVDTLTLRFPEETSIVETPPLSPGVYDIGVRGGTALLAVNESRELLPRGPRVTSRRVGGGSISGDATRSLRSSGWPYALVILLLCAEWILRRRRGMR